MDIDDGILNEKLLRFLVYHEKGVTNYIHRTTRADVAKKIIQEGFHFTDSFYKTTDEVVNNPNYLRFWLRARSYYGKYIIVLSLSKDIVRYYINELKKQLLARVEVYQVLTVNEPYLDDEENEVYTIPNQYIKGYFNAETGEKVLNEDYDPFYDPPNFKKNIQRFKDELNK